MPLNAAAGAFNPNPAASEFVPSFAPAPAAVAASAAPKGAWGKGPTAAEKMRMEQKRKEEEALMAREQEKKTAQELLEAANTRHLLQQQGMQKEKIQQQHLRTEVSISDDDTAAHATSSDTASSATSKQAETSPACWKDASAVSIVDAAASGSLEEV